MQPPTRTSLRAARDDEAESCEKSTARRATCTGPGSDPKLCRRWSPDSRSSHPQCHSQSRATSQRVIKRTTREQAKGFGFHYRRRKAIHAQLQLGLLPRIGWNGRRGAKVAGQGTGCALSVQDYLEWHLRYADEAVQIRDVRRKDLAVCGLYHVAAKVRRHERAAAYGYRAGPGVETRGWLGFGRAQAG